MRVSGRCSHATLSDRVGVVRAMVVYVVHMRTVNETRLGTDQSRTRLPDCYQQSAGEHPGASPRAS